MNQPFVPIGDSLAQAHGTHISHPNPSLVLKVSLFVNYNQEDAIERAKKLDLVFSQPKQRSYLDRAELGEIFGPSEEDLEKLRTYLESCGITIEEISPLKRRVDVVGPVSAFEKAFHTKLLTFEAPGREQHVSYTGYLYLPVDLVTFVRMVEGLSVKPKVEYRRPSVQAATSDTDPSSAGYSPVRLGAAYQFPGGATGDGQCIGVIELGGHYSEEDFKKFFAENDLPEPVIITVGEASGRDSMMANAEVTLDLQIIGALAPCARIIVYYGQSILECMKLIINDSVNKPDVVSISWAGIEANFSSTHTEELQQVFFEAALLGITVVASSGDHGAYNGQPQPSVMLPASISLVLGCGGTIVHLDDDDQIVKEKVWNENLSNTIYATGGGYSSSLPQPYYQRMAVSKYPYQKGMTRAVPDVCANASLKFGYKVVFNGQDAVIGGTSAATPLWAALIAGLNECLGYKLGFFNHLLYQLAGSSAFRQIVCGNNQYYRAGPYWNPCCGLGSPVGETILKGIEDLSEKL